MSEVGREQGGREGELCIGLLVRDKQTESEYTLPTHGRTKK